MEKQTRQRVGGRCTLWRDLLSVLSATLASAAAVPQFQALCAGRVVALCRAICARVSRAARATARFLLAFDCHNSHKVLAFSDKRRVCVCVCVGGRCPGGGWGGVAMQKGEF